jgi:hypothetical protein
LQQACDWQKNAKTTCRLWQGVIQEEQVNVMSTVYSHLHVKASVVQEAAGQAWETWVVCTS